MLDYLDNKKALELYASRVLGLHWTSLNLNMVG